MTDIKLSVLIVNYNSGALTATNIQALYQSGLPDKTEIIVVDNNSTDDSVSFLQSDFPEITLVANETNRGLAAAVNQAIAQAAGEYYLLLNPDIVALPNAVKNLLAFMDAHLKVGLAGGKLLSPNGELQHSCYRFYAPLTVLYRRTALGHTRFGRAAVDQFLMKDYDHELPRDVDWLMGSCYCLRATAVAEVGGMDERFFLYFEDVDWCRRFWEGNWQVFFVPSAQFSHFHQQSSRQRPLLGIITNWTTREHIRSALKYFAKYWRKPLPHHEPTG